MYSFSASVNGKASADKFGAWRVKEITENIVIFEVTKEAVAWKSFEGFSITAPNTIEGMVRWFTNYDYAVTLGPVGVKYQTE